MKKKLKVTWKPDILEEAKTLGYIEGFNDGRNSLLNNLIKFKFLKKNWETEYDKKMKNEGYMVK
jgi:hypothetical protein